MNFLRLDLPPNVVRLLCAGLFAFSSSSHAAHLPPVVTGTMFVGPDLVFIVEDGTLFGAASLNNDGDGIVFLDPSAFLAESQNGDGALSVRDTVQIEIYTKDGSAVAMDSFSLFEAGDYSLTGAGTSTSVDARLEVSTRTGVDCFNALFGINYDCTTSEIFVGVDENDLGALDNQTGVNENWILGGIIDLDDVQSWNQDSHVIVEIQNTLRVNSSNPSELATIQKKQGFLGITVEAEIPLPPAAWLFGSALVGLFGYARKQTMS